MLLCTCYLTIALYMSSWAQGPREKTVKLVMLTGIMFNDFPKNESTCIDMLTVIKLTVLAVTVIYQL